MAGNGKEMAWKWSSLRVEKDFQHQLDDHTDWIQPLVKQGIHSTLEGLPRFEPMECGHWINHWGEHGVIHWNSLGTHRIDAVIADAESLEKERESQSYGCHYTFGDSNGNCSLHPTTASLHRNSHIAAADNVQWVVVAAAAAVAASVVADGHSFGGPADTASDGHGHGYEHGLDDTNELVVVAVNSTVPAFAVAAAVVVAVAVEEYPSPSMNSMHWNN